MDVPVSFLTSPSSIVNQAIDMLGQPGKIIGDIADGTPVAETARRNYGQALRQLLRTAHWDFARKRARLVLLGDATGTALPLGVSPLVECPWQFAYEWPLDGLQGRWLPWNPTNAQPTNSSGVPLTTGVSIGVNYPMVPGRFLVSSSELYPVELGSVPWNQLPDFQRTAGVGPISRKVILTDCCNAEFVYTKLVTTIEEWDALFRDAMVTMMALILAPVAIEDPKLRAEERNRLVPVLKNSIDNARVANGNEAGMPQSTDTTPPWITARSGGWWGAQQGLGGSLWGGTGLGGFGLGWESMSFGGSVY